MYEILVTICIFCVFLVFVFSVDRRTNDPKLHAKRIAQLKAREAVWERQAIANADRENLTWYRAQASQLRHMLAQLPEDTMSGRVGLECRLEEIEQEIRYLEEQLCGVDGDSTEPRSKR